MSTKSSILYRPATQDEPGIHIYDECFDWWNNSAPDVYVEVEGELNVKFETLPDGKQQLTFNLPRKTAIALGLIPPPHAEPAGDTR